MSLGAGAYKVGGARQCVSTRKEVVRGPTRHCHAELFSEILNNQYLPSPELEREGGLGKTVQKLHASNKAIETHREELKARNCVHKS